MFMGAQRRLMKQVMKTALKRKVEGELPAA
jgi:hypothetical protein